MPCLGGAGAGACRDDQRKCGDGRRGDRVPGTAAWIDWGCTGHALEQQHPGGYSRLDGAARRGPGEVRTGRVGPRERARYAHRGERIGEATHPGPASDGGSRVPRRGPTETAAYGLRAVRIGEAAHPGPPLRGRAGHLVQRHLADTPIGRLLGAVRPEEGPVPIVEGGQGGPGASAQEAVRAEGERRPGAGRRRRDATPDPTVRRRDAVQTAPPGSGLPPCSSWFCSTCPSPTGSGRSPACTVC